MHAFVPVPGGHAARLEDAERRVVARLVADVAELLGTRLDDDEADAADADAAEGAVGGSRHHTQHEAAHHTDPDAVLAALDFSPAAHRAPDAPADPALARLLPPMSREPELAAELRGLTEEGLRTAKVARLESVWRELRRPSPAGGAAVVRTGEEGTWLSALTDVRLVLASRLGIEDDEDAEAVYDRADRADTRRGRHRRGGGHDEVADALATMYAALTWWQESLLESMRRRRTPK